MPRVWDALPFDYRSFAPYQKNEDLLALLKLQESGVIQWSVHEMPSEKSGRSACAKASSAIEHLDCIVNRWSAARRESLVAMIRYMEGVWPVSLDGCVSAQHDGREVDLGGIRYCVGAPYIDSRFLEERFSKLEIVFALPWKEKGRNLIWRISRGPNHPHYIEFANTTAWVHWDVSQRTPSFQLLCHIDDLWGNAVSVAMFTTQQRANEELQNLVDEELVARDTFVSREVGGCELVDIMFAIDHVDLDCGEYSRAFNRRAALISTIDLQSDALSVLRSLKAGTALSTLEESELPVNHTHA